MSGRIPVATALWTEVGPIADLIAATFHDLPQDRWLVGDPDQRRVVMPGYFAILVQEAMAGGTVHTSVDGHAAAVWLTATGDIGPGGGHDARVAAATGAYADRFATLEAALAAAQPAEPAHHHLALLAVRPGHQRQGYGTALLAFHHRQLDRLRLPAYLDAATEASRGFYLRRGYHDAGPPITIGDDGPVLWPMWREAQRAPSI